MIIDKLKIYEALYNGLASASHGIVDVPEFVHYDTSEASKFLREMADDMDKISKGKYPDGMPF